MDIGCFFGFSGGLPVAGEARAWPAWFDVHLCGAHGATCVPG